MALDLDVGAIGSRLRLWRAREMVRHAELRLTAQASALQGTQMRATNLMGWVVTAVSAIGGLDVLSVAGGAWLRSAAIGAGLVPALIGAFAATTVLSPKRWHDPGTAAMTGAAESESELHELEAVAAGYALIIEENRAFLDRAARLMRFAWWMLFATPLTVASLTAFSFAIGG